jgi:hypothetical protein
MGNVRKIHLFGNIRSVSIVTFLLLFPFLVEAQGNSATGVFIDTLTAFSESCSVYHYHERSSDRAKQMFSMNDDDIFDSSINNFSTIKILQSGFDPIEVHTIPLDNIIILEDKKLIIGLTKIEVSPFKIVIYKFDGHLIYKGNLGVSVIRINYPKLKQLTQRFPSLIASFKASGNVIKQDSLFSVELTPSAKKILGSDFMRKYLLENWIFSGYLSFHIATNCWGGDYYHRLLGGYMGSSPYNNLISIGDVPFILILNDVQGGKSYIPLVSNCDIQSELVNK